MAQSNWGLLTFEQFTEDNSLVNHSSRVYYPTENYPEYDNLTPNQDLDNPDPT